MTTTKTSDSAMGNQRNADNRRLGWTIAAVACAVFFLVLFLKS